MDYSKMNWVQLQNALYEAHSKYDEESTREEGKKEIQAIYDEYAKRGVSKVVLPEAIR
ncbi:MAG: hypothetical protein ACLFUS_17760 [Candidatus Sumerlaeia bacterium]